jgi:hypothetical protein
VFSSGWSQDVESAPETKRARGPDSDSSTYTTSFLHSPSPGRSPQWGHRPGNAQAPLDGAFGGLKATLAFFPCDSDLLRDDWSLMSWHTSRLTCLAGPLADGVFLAFLAPCVPSPQWLWRLPLALRPIVSNDLLSVRAQPPVTRCSLRLSTTAGRPVGGDPIYTTAFSQARKNNGPPPPAPRPQPDSAPKHCLGLFEFCPLR